MFCEHLRCLSPSFASDMGHSQVIHPLPVLPHLAAAAIIVTSTFHTTTRHVPLVARTLRVHCSWAQRRRIMDWGCVGGKDCGGQSFGRRRDCDGEVSGCLRLCCLYAMRFCYELTCVCAVAQTAAMGSVSSIYFPAVLMVT